MNELNKEQQLAVLTTQGAVLVLSGAGTGKTKVLTSRLAYILENGLARPWECLAVTFTNKAAAEMKERLAALTGTALASDVWLGTFHRISLKILRRFSEKTGYSSDFIILGDDDQKRLIKQLMEEEGLDTKKHSPEAVLNVIQGWKDKGFLPENVIKGDAKDFMGGKILNLYHQYQNRLKALNSMDFGDLLLLTVELFKTCPDVLEKYQNQFRYIMVDEYQDTNTIQYLWLRMLAKGHGNICCVGDDDQSIYSWRGAQINNILQFDKDFPNATVIRLEQNYRSGSHILAAASALISNNKSRLGKKLKVAEGRLDDNIKVKVTGVWDWRQEATNAVQIIEDARRRNLPYKEIAVLVRTGSQTREFEETFISNSIPYQVIGAGKFYEREEIRDAVAYLRACFMPDDDMALARIINKPRRGIGEASLGIVRSYALSQNISLFKAAEILCNGDSEATTGPLKTAAKSSLKRFLDNLHGWQDFTDTLPPSEAAAKIFEDSGYLAMWQESKLPEAEGRLDNLKELLGVIKFNFDSIGAFLEHVALISDTDDLSPLDKVNIMTLHSAKGLEFDTVILAGWEEGLFPHNRSIEEGGQEGVEEERRLAYVGMTRAKHHLYISFASNRRLFNEWQNNLPSRFLAELPQEDIEGLKPARPSYPDFKQAKMVWKKPSKVLTSAKSTPSGIKVGQQVRHKTFGIGVVAKIDADKLEIFFADAGKKNILSDFVEPI